MIKDTISDMKSIMSHGSVQLSCEGSIMALEKDEASGDIYH